MCSHALHNNGSKTFLRFSFFTSLVFLQPARAVKFPQLFYLKPAIHYQKLLLHKMHINLYQLPWSK